MSTTTTRAAVPAVVQWARALLAVVALSHLMVPIVLYAGRAGLRATIAAQHPAFSGAEVSRSVGIAVGSGVAFHGVLLVLCAALVWLLRTPRPWVRRLTTISQLLSVLFSVVSWSSSPMFHPVIPVVGAVQVAVVLLLWVPRPAAAFFAR